MSSPLKFVLLLSGVLLGALSLGAQPPRGGPGGPGGPAGPASAPGRISPHETVSAAIGGFNGPRVTIVYGRPYSRNPNPPGEIRKIFGGLVPWGQADRMGADEATTLITQQEELETAIDGDLKPRSFEFAGVELRAQVDVERAVKTVNNVAAWLPGEVEKWAAVIKAANVTVD